MGVGVMVAVGLCVGVDVIDKGEEQLVKNTIKIEKKAIFLMDKLYSLEANVPRPRSVHFAAGVQPDGLTFARYQVAFPMGGW